MPTLIFLDCPSAPAVANAVVNIPLIRHDEQQLTYKCKNKFYLYGPNTVTCQNDTTWSSIMFSCIGKFMKSRSFSIFTIHIHVSGLTGKQNNLSFRFENPFMY